MSAARRKKAARGAASRKRKHDCAVCGQLFDNITDHMDHYVREHDRGFRPPEQRTLRPVSCWRCVTPIPTAQHGRIVCHNCGFVYPVKDQVTRTFIIPGAQDPEDESDRSDED